MFVLWSFTDNTLQEYNQLYLSFHEITMCILSLQHATTLENDKSSFTILERFDVSYLSNTKNICGYMNTRFDNFVLMLTTCYIMNPQKKDLTTVSQC